MAAPELTPEALLTTTRTVRKRLDLTRPVERDVLADCLRIAFQAPNGSNLQLADWVIVDVFPVAYTVGTDFKPADRSRSERAIHWNHW